MHLKKKLKLERLQNVNLLAVECVDSSFAGVGLLRLLGFGVSVSGFLIATIATFTRAHT